MAGNRDGGLQTAETVKALYGADYYVRIGAIGGAKRGRKGFAVSGKAREAGTKGGRISKRGFRYVNGEYIDKQYAN